MPTAILTNRLTVVTGLRKTRTASPPDNKGKWFPHVLEERLPPAGIRSRSPSQIVSIDVYFPLRTFGQFRPLAEDAISLEIPLRMDFATRGFPSAFFT